MPSGRPSAVRWSDRSARERPAPVAPTEDPRLRFRSGDLYGHDVTQLTRCLARGPEPHVRPPRGQPVIGAPGGRHRRCGMAEPRILGIVLAGGAGTRLAPLTEDRAKPAVPFGGLYRLIDFALSNLVNAGVLRIAVLTQYKSHSLDRHITSTWRMSALLGNYVTPVPAQQRLGPRWFKGSADAIHQSLNLVYDDQPDHVVVFGADHVYRMDPRQMVDQHVASGAAVTVAG